MEICKNIIIFCWNDIFPSFLILYAYFTIASFVFLIMRFGMRLFFVAFDLVALHIKIHNISILYMNTTNLVFIKSRFPSTSIINVVFISKGKHDLTRLVNKAILVFPIVVSVCMNESYPLGK